MLLKATPHGALRGDIRVPGDKSISHRSLMLAGLAVGESRISGLLEGADVLATATALNALGVRIERLGPGEWRAIGCGVAGLAEPDAVLDLGNAGTGVRLLMGILAGHGFTSFLSGDASLRRRPMRRIAEPLEAMGAHGAEPLGRSPAAGADRPGRPRCRSPGARRWRPPRSSPLSSSPACMRRAERR